MQSSARRWQWAERRVGAIGMHLLRVGMGPDPRDARRVVRPALCTGQKQIEGRNLLGLTNIFRNLIQNKVLGEKSAFFKILIKIKYISIKTLIEIKCISTK